MDTIDGLDLKVRRVRAGLRQFEVATAAGLSPSVLSMMENGRRPLPAEQAAAILAAIGRLAGTATGRGSSCSRTDEDERPAARAVSPTPVVIRTDQSDGAER